MTEAHNQPKLPNIVNQSLFKNKKRLQKRIETQQKNISRELLILGIYSKVKH